MSITEFNAFSLVTDPLDSIIDSAHHRLSRCINRRVSLSEGHLSPFAVIYLEEC